MQHFHLRGGQQIVGRIEWGPGAVQRSPAITAIPDRSRSSRAPPPAPPHQLGGRIPGRTHGRRRARAVGFRLAQRMTTGGRPPTRVRGRLRFPDRLIDHLGVDGQRPKRLAVPDSISIAGSRPRDGYSGVHGGIPADDGTGLEGCRMTPFGMMLSVYPSESVLVVLDRHNGKEKGRPPRVRLSIRSAPGGRATQHRAGSDSR